MLRVNKKNKLNVIDFKNNFYICHMDIPLFLKSLSLEEREMMKFHLQNMPVTTREFINRHKLSKRVLTVLVDNSGYGEVFEYVSQINRIQFLKLPMAGKKMWEELEKILPKKNG